MCPLELISPGSLESQKNEMGTSRVQIIRLNLDIFFRLLPKSGQITTISTSHSERHRFPLQNVRGVTARRPWPVRRDQPLSLSVSVL